MTTYIAQVRGIAWAGYKASTEYTFDHKPSKEEIRSAAGDFQAITTACVIERVCTAQQVARYRY